MKGQEMYPSGVIAAVVRTFLTGKFALIFIITALSLGGAALFLTPQEEEPQIVVPLADIYVHFPGGSAEEVEKLVATPLERLLWQIDGVEYVYSTSHRDMAVVTVRFYVGEDREDSLIKLHNKITANQNLVPQGVSGWIVKPVEIDDVPILSFTLHSQRYDDHVLRRIGEEVLSRLDTVENISRTRIVGGRAKQVRVELDPESMQARDISTMEVFQVLKAADASLTSGAFDRNNTHINVTSGPFITSAEEVKDIVVGVYDNRPIYIRDVAEVFEGPEESHSYSRIGFHSEGNDDFVTYPAVTLAIAKKKGSNAVTVARDVIAKMETLKEDVIPSGVGVSVTRNYGETAHAKVSELLSALFFAIVTVVVLLVIALGWREGVIVALAVPLSFALALFVNYIFGYTINRVTLFALILTLGLVVDDPITNVDNIQRHMAMGKRKPFFATLWAVQEVIPPVIMSTLAIIISFVPMFFITGMMGPYMEPMSINVPLAVTFSTVASLTVVPWAAYHLLKGKKVQTLDDEDAVAPWMKRIYSRLLSPFLSSRSWRKALFITVAALLVISGLLVVMRMVPMKMLPFDNKDELQLVITMPEGTTLESTDAAVRDFEYYLSSVPEVINFVTYTGTYSPIDFNGLVRHYYFREAANVAEVRINFLGKEMRDQQSHEIALRIRKDLEGIASKNRARLAIVETPPGPPVISTVAAEVYGAMHTPYSSMIAAGRYLTYVMNGEKGVVDIDISAEDRHQRLDFILDKEKAALHGIDTDTVVKTLHINLEGIESSTVHSGKERTPLPVVIQCSREKRSGREELGRIIVKGSSGESVPLDEIGAFVLKDEDQPIYHKNLERVVYVFGEMAGRAPGEAVIDMSSSLEEKPYHEDIKVVWDGEGEWFITLRVFRDLGIAFAAAMIGIYILLVMQTDSFLMPCVIMSAIPLTAIGIMPGFFFLNIYMNKPIGGFENPVFFTATAMIGMIALGGIVVRNSIVLIEFIQGAVKGGKPLREAILVSGAVRMRPIVLTAATTSLGVWPITLDPIFSGLAWSLIFGLVVSTIFTLIVIPVMYAMIYGKEALSQERVTREDR
jgi:multidrug efflux pump subunit AcrB